MKKFTFQWLVVVVVVVGFLLLLSSGVDEYQSVVSVLLSRALVVGSPVEVLLVNSNVSVFVRAAGFLSLEF